jgi:EAL domain-containing protein (putative c-di-GMP-specific phosphodiesterase class I)
VETQEIWDRLRASGCDAAQGYLLARPMAVDQLGGWLAGRPPVAAPADL